MPTQLDNLPSMTKTQDAGKEIGLLPKKYQESSSGQEKKLLIVKKIICKQIFLILIRLEKN